MAYLMRLRRFNPLRSLIKVAIASVPPSGGSAFDCSKKLLPEQEDEDGGVQVSLSQGLHVREQIYGLSISLCLPVFVSLHFLIREWISFRRKKVPR